MQIHYVQVGILKTLAVAFKGEHVLYMCTQLNHVCKVVTVQMIYNLRMCNL